ncbi:MAG: DUF4097 family beta strand repeat-containing protein [Acetatifactor sp.]
MSKAEYMNSLKEKLQCFNIDLQREIFEDYEEHFTEGAVLGKTEEQIIEELGSIDDMIGEISEEELKQEIMLSGETSEKAIVCGGEHNTVVLDGLVANVTVSESTDGKVHVEYHNNGSMIQQQRYLFYQREENGVFYAGVEKNMNVDMTGGKKSYKFELFGKTFFSYGSNADNIDESIRLDVQIPANMRSVEVKTLSGDIEVSGIRVGNLKINTTSGDIHMASLKAEAVKTNSTSGDAVIIGIEVPDVTLQTSSGDMTLAELMTSELKIQAASGDIVGKNIRGRKITGGTGSGDMELLTECTECIFTTGSGDIMMKVTGRPERIKLNAGSGNIVLSLRSAEDLAVTVGTGSGDGVICMNGKRHEVSGRSCTIGNGSRRVVVGTGSGDVEVRCGK